MTPHLRHRLIHMTIRDPDCRAFDVAHMVRTFSDWNVTGFSFCAAGYITTYPSRLPYMRVSPGMNERDLAGEIIEGAHDANMIAVPMIDLGELPLETADAYPEWAGRDREGRYFFRTDSIVSACPNGGYVREASREVVRELSERYELDGMKFGGASQIMPGTVCYCENCERAYRSETGRELPPDDGLSQLEYQQYLAWRDEVKGRTVSFLVDMVHEEAGVNVVSNAVWQLGDGSDIRDLARSQDWVQVEVQPKYVGFSDSSEPLWERLTLATETSRYVTPLTKEPPWVVASYFLAWPWRRIATPYHDQKLILAQLAANGAAPMVNLSGGPPLVHEDPRGFRAIDEIYGFIARNPDVFEADESAARVALVYSEESSILGERIQQPGDAYRFGFRSTEDVLDRSHIAYDIVSASDLSSVPGDRYDALLLPSASILSDTSIRAMVDLNEAGTGVVAWGDPARFDPRGERRPGVALSSLLPVTEVADAGGLLAAAGEVGVAQAYLRVASRSEPMTATLPSDLLPAAGPWWRVRPLESARVPLRRGPAFRVSPEGLSYPDKSPDDPMLILNEIRDAGRVAYLAFDAGFCAGRTAHPDIGALIADSVRWASRTPLPVEVDAPADVLVSLRRRENRLFVHMINTTGRSRFITRFVPVHDLEVCFAPHMPVRAARIAGTNTLLPVHRTDSGSTVLVPTLVDYDVLAIDLSSSVGSPTQA